MKHKLLIALLLSFFVLTPITPLPAHAHPGRTDSSGGHTCRTNCKRWGLGYSEYHSHGGGSASGGSMESTNTAPVRETSQPESSQKFMDYRNAVLTGTPTNIPTRIPTRRPTSVLFPTATLAPSPTATPAPTMAPAKSARPVQASTQAPKQPGFFEWLFSLFRGK